jgi:hypothetical protein
MVTNISIPLRGWGVCVPIPCATRSKAWVYGHSHSGTVGSNHAGGKKICLLLSILYIVRLMSLERADRSSDSCPAKTKVGGGVVFVGKLSTNWHFGSQILNF